MIRVYGTACMATTIGVMLGMVSPKSIYLDWYLVGARFQIWRLLTNFIFLGGFGFPFVMRMLYIARYGVQLERAAYEGRPADFAWMLIFNMIVLLAVQLVAPFTRMSFSGIPLVFSLVYLWSREFPTADVGIYGLFKVKAFYLPWTLMAIDMLLGQSIMEDVLGILTAHLYYFFAVLYPRTGGPNFLQTPELVKQMVYSAFGGVAGPGGSVQRPAPRAFQGRGRRLGD